MVSRRMKSFTHTASLLVLQLQCWIDATRAPFDMMQKARCATMTEHSSGPLIDVSPQAGMIEDSWDIKAAGAAVGRNVSVYSLAAWKLLGGV